jgi:hypothetical protein
MYDVGKGSLVKNYCQNHPVFPVPENLDTRIWRYMELYKFKWLIEEERLYMPLVGDLGDSLEGTISEGQRTGWNNQRLSVEQCSLKIFDHNINFFEKFAYKISQKSFVSCWHMNAESLPNMFEAFFPYSEDVVAICSTYKKLREEMLPFVCIGMINYIDHKNEVLFSQRHNLFECIMTKDKMKCEWEKEIRCVAHYPGRFGIEYEDPQSVYKREDNEKPVYAPKINLKNLVHSIHLPPSSNTKHCDNVIQILGLKNLQHLLVPTDIHIAV